MKNKDIIIFSAIDWDTQWQWQQELAIHFAKKKEANVIIRGLSAVSDFEYEFQMTGMNYKLNSEIETIFLMSSDKYQLISSKLIKEISQLNGDISKFVPKIVKKELEKKYS